MSTFDPLDVELDTLPDEDDVEETLPEDVEDVLEIVAPPVEVEPPLVDELVDPPLDVDEITMLPLDPPLPPPKPPPKPPPPKKPPPPITAGTMPPPPPMKPSPIGAGIGTGGALATVTTAGGQLVVVVLVTIRRRGAREATCVRWTTRLTTFCLAAFCFTTAARGRSAT